jgi:hypothetical protein
MHKPWKGGENVNPYTGHLVRLQDNETPPEQYEILPEQLNRAARRKLAGKNEATVSLTSGGKLSKWAAEKRKSKRKMAKASRKRNRSKTK